jgi:hypothetical protein
MRATSWFLSFALLLMLLDIGWERTRRERERTRQPVAEETGEAQALDGSEGQPPPPKP